MRVYLVAPVPLSALVIGWAVGWSLGLLILIAACLSLGFGAGFWWACSQNTRRMWASRSSLVVRRLSLMVFACWPEGNQSQAMLARLLRTNRR